MAYTIMRFKKDKGGAVAGCERHNERKNEAEFNMAIAEDFSK